jgi:serine/threonine protein kinase
MGESHPESDKEDSLDAVLAEYEVALDRGDTISREDFVARHPDHADRLRRYFADADAVGKLAETTALRETARIPKGASQRPSALDDFELVREIACGGMGAVYEARQRSLHRTVALKLILSGQFATLEEVDRFRREAEMAANLRHPHIVGVYQVGEHAGQHYFAMEYIEGRSLADGLGERMRRPSTGPTVPPKACCLPVSRGQAGRR